MAGACFPYESEQTRCFSKCTGFEFTKKVQ